MTDSSRTLAGTLDAISVQSSNVHNVGAGGVNKYGAIDNKIDASTKRCIQCLDRALRANGHRLCDI